MIKKTQNERINNNNITLIRFEITLEELKKKNVSKKYFDR